ncbi:hypothetical protein SPRG_00522 [Saprolegnia parasitica CBS 223.65]|uniref:SET domain-containing protein n=1 Tax=Saprolegnia parasitica (strain CBS 223.65) TaxID=695850 RepID=A0A067CVA4_SAPPC|nr:hypothetical protein SPRG_00522 [Saprolegnia parasitica CBS 223.65]KDO34458.1 hypothetical protein SPRG_00522 [Saprolegnia parasitica CBS 223.65]|eukprot:XP_012194140.1 hypothetical protein SPRG_00522 [Saprolegnia parasitica CBS 223.65]
MMDDDASFVGYNTWAVEALDVALNADLVYEESSGGDRGVFVSEAIKAHTAILSIPFESLLNLYSIAASPLAEIPHLHEREDDCLAWFLLYETHLNKASKWARHIAVLPRTFHNILYLSDADIERLEGSNVYYVARHLQSQVAADFDELTTTILPETLRALAADHPADAILSAFTLENYKWALSVIWSRFVSVATSTDSMVKCMVPVFDMFNHDPSAQMAHGFDPRTNSFVLQSHQYWAPGAQVFINYGALPNHKLLTLYGFVLEKNAYDTVELWAPMSHDAPYYDRKMAFITAHGLAHHARVPFDLTTLGVNEELLAYLRIQRMEVDELSSFEGSTFAYKALSNENEKSTLTALIFALQSMRDRFPTSIEDDDALLKTLSEADAHTRMVVLLRRSDKAILTQHIDWLQEKLIPVLADMTANAQD